MTKHDNEIRWNLIMDRKGIEMRDIVKKLSISAKVTIKCMGYAIDKKIKEMKNLEGTLYV